MKKAAELNEQNNDQDENQDSSDECVVDDAEERRDSGIMANLSDYDD